jgi:hypothetical protein
MTYTYTSPKKIAITATLDQNKMSVITQKKNEESILDIYEYTDILEVNLSFVSRNHYATKIYFKNNDEFQIRNLSVENGSYKNQSDQYIDWILLLHKNLKYSDLNSKIEFTQGNSNQYYLYCAIGIVGMLGCIITLFLELYLNAFVLLIPVVISILFLSNSGMTKPYNQEELPGKYLPKV